MNVRTDRQTNRQTDEIHRYHIYVGLAQAHPNQLVSEVIPLLTVDRFEGFLNQCKIDEMVNDNSSSCNSKLLLKKDDLQYLNTYTNNYCIGYLN